MKLIFGLIFFLFIVNPGLWADTIILKSGKAIEGKVTKQNADTITYTGGDGKKQILPKSVLFRVLYNPTKAEKEKIITQALDFSKKEINKDKIKDAKALEEYQKAEEERIKELEAILDKLKVEKQEEEPSVIELRNKYNQLEARVRDMELFLNLNTDWKEYYTKPRSRWDIIWRSALIPGWGHSYAQEGFVSNIYATLFILGIAGAAAGSAAERTADSAYGTKVTGTITKQYIYNYVLSSSPSVTSTTQISILTQYSQYSVYNDFKKSNDVVHNAHMAKTSAVNFVVGIYALQLIHSFVTGYFWEKKQIFPKTEEQNQSGWNIQVNPVYAPGVNSSTKNYQAEFGYYVRF